MDGWLCGGAYWLGMGALLALAARKTGESWLSAVLVALLWPLCLLGWALVPLLLVLVALFFGTPIEEMLRSLF